MRWENIENELWSAFFFIVVVSSFLIFSMKFERKKLLQGQRYIDLNESILRKLALFSHHLFKQRRKRNHWNTSYLCHKKMNKIAIQIVFSYFFKNQINADELGFKYWKCGAGKGVRLWSKSANMTSPIFHNEAWIRLWMGSKVHRKKCRTSHKSAWFYFALWRREIFSSLDMMRVLAYSLKNETYLL